MKPTKRLKPDVGDIIQHHMITQDIKISGEVIDLLDKQFTIRIQSPNSIKGKTYFIFYNDDYIII